MLQNDFRLRDSATSEGASPGNGHLTHILMLDTLKNTAVPDLLGRLEICPSRRGKNKRIYRKERAHERVCLPVGNISYD